MRTGTADQVAHSKQLLKTSAFSVVVTLATHRRGQKKHSRRITPLKCMHPAPQTHFNARRRQNDSAYPHEAYHVKMHDCSARSSIHRKREARTQPANVTHRLEGKRRKSRDKKHETSSHSSADMRLGKKTHTTVSPLKKATDCKIAKRDT